MTATDPHMPVVEGLAGWTERERRLSYLDTTPILMFNGHDWRIVWVLASLFAANYPFFLLEVIFSGPGQFTITSVSIGANRDFIDVTYMEVSRVI